ncbi:hypothetical protein [Hippea alviniae]|uniref:hypothetical protein n=1 Tax=Hippea alviniae TaxID=1279027 RepID=UPI0012DEB2DB|nr:hypothetical protein [Hippea alviniae]
MKNNIFPLGNYKEKEMEFIKPRQPFISSFFDAFQSKIYFIFLFITQETLKRESNRKLFAVMLCDIKRILGSHNTTSHNETYYKEKIREISNKNILYRPNLDDDNYNYTKIPALKSVQFHKKQEGEIVCLFELPDSIIELLLI